MNEYSRRTILLGGLGLAGAATTLFLAPPTAARADTPVGSVGGWTAGRSSNGWPVLDRPVTSLIEGSEAQLQTAAGDAAVILTHLARRFNYEIAPLGPDEVTGWTSDRSVGADYESNYLSGTAVALRPNNYPLGATNNFYASELVVIRDVLAECRGVVRWGGDEAVPKESHFQLDLPPTDPRVRQLAETITGWKSAPGEGAGSVDPFTQSRRRAAEVMAERQAND